MRVLYDGVAFENRHQRGVQRVFREIIDHMPGEVDARMCVAGPALGTFPARATIVRTGLPGAGLLPSKLRRPLQSVLAPITVRRECGRCDVFHSTYYTLPPRDAPSVVHVLDMIAERYVDFYQGRWLEREIERKRLAIQSATKIIAISNATARELVHFYPGCRDRVTVVHLGADHVAEGSPDPAPDQARPYVLFVGERGLYKNFGAVLDAMELESWPRVGLTVVGPPWKANEALRVERLPPGRMVLHAGRTSDAELWRLYRRAVGVLIPALVEGFGLPVLEAQRAGVPALCSDIEVFREVAGDKALFFDPRRPETIALRVNEVLDAGLRERIVDGARGNAAGFSWDRTAAATLNVYRSVGAETTGSGSASAR